MSSKSKNDIILVPEGYSMADCILGELQCYSVQPLAWSDIEFLQTSYGKNTVAEKKPVRWYAIVFHALIHPFNILLVILAIFSGATGEIDTTIIMIVMVALSVVLRSVQEFKSEVAAQSLKEMVNNKCTVIRKYAAPDTRDPLLEDLLKIERGEVAEYEIPFEDIVPGDCIKLRAGDLVPADLQLILSKDLFISQASLTGEAMPVEKSSSGFILPTNPSTPADSGEDIYGLSRPDMCFMGTSVVSGTAIGIVKTIGTNTVFGVMAKQLIAQRPINAFQKGIRRISYLFIGIMLIMLPLVFVISGITSHDWLQAALFAASVAVGLTPEMLPMIVNANLARGALVLSKKKCIVKKLDSIVNMGSIDVLCTDKTGTLTEDKVSLVKHLNSSGQPSLFPLELAFLNSNFQTGLKNLLDFAVIEYYNKKPSLSLGEYSKVDEIPFDFVRRKMSVVIRDRSNMDHLLITKGAVDEMLASCSRIFVGSQPNSDEARGGITLPTDSIIDLTDDHRSELQALNHELNDDGLRVIAVAYRVLDRDYKDLTTAQETKMIFAGYIAFLDPPKPSTAVAIRELREYGVTIKVLTGDAAAVCRKVCQEIQLPVNSIVTTTDLEDVSEERFTEIVEEGTIFAKLTPIQKAQVIRALKKKGHVVGFLGDGINDAPALRESDCGISVDTGTDIAKESADIILLEKDLMVLVDGVIRGRITYGNTIKYIKMAISSNFGNVFSMLVASIWLPFLPMLPIQVLVQNLLYDISQIAIPWDRMDQDFLNTPKSWSAKGIIRFMAFIGPISSIFDVTTFIYMWFYFGCTTPDDQALFQSGWFVIGLLTQTLIVHMIRTPLIPFIQSRASLPLLLSTFAVMVIGFIIPFTPLKQALSMVTLPGMYYPYLFSALLAYCLLTQLIKAIYIWYFRTWL
ncbi:magnesium-translocating P-type ATPase [Basidiobolus meristosporus CBS 931.73]|uniref:Magnesium-transporting ATPase, P-type 1 n=1 Tax=Basidiobolus meristosporus CBS 931.73 TaxID=1314790 RepID=A0A1Y1XVL6_9FUNG|nr:magnesium-translocating P-type ATPase [Basidiobolus meristosporus CBS 931.73]|eukprot:ORX89798.1 magnesium-translocating P-type ATPase [Basidiobolus meristosporus CBS 931.73]